METPDPEKFKKDLEDGLDALANAHKKLLAANLEFFEDEDQFPQVWTGNKYVPETDEAELRVMTKNMYIDGGVPNVLSCIRTMQQSEFIIMDTMRELIREELKKEKTEDI